MKHIIEAMNEWIEAQEDLRENYEFGLYIASGGGEDTDIYVGRVVNIFTIVPDNAWVLHVQQSGQDHEVFFTPAQQVLFTAGKAKGPEEPCDDRPTLLIDHEGKTLIANDQDIVEESMDENHVIWELCGATWEAKADGESHKSYFGDVETHKDNLRLPTIVVPKSILSLDIGESDTGEYLSLEEINVSNIGVDDARHRHDLVVRSKEDPGMESFVPVGILFGNRGD